ncbi:insecticidal delta-endotoxin Cry8Ea1 family protein [Streptomyces sp. NPDC091287]|uniref:insecticidal delta-endotoxin Cry8Ea1 family protein n=1 Tax=Streptomyces sp. NPDC091287 TaxID=3365988 RepID=UPI0037FC0C06
MSAEHQGSSDAAEVDGEYYPTPNVPDTFRRSPGVDEEPDTEFLLEMSKEAIVTVISMIPAAGPLLGLIASGVLKLFWPTSSQRDVWAEIRAQVEALIDEKLGELWADIVTSDLAWCKAKVDTYVREAKRAASGNQNDIQAALNAYITANTDLVGMFERFTKPAHGWKTLHVFAQYANLHVLLLRDAIANADRIALGEERLEEAKNLLTKVAKPATPTMFGHWVGGTYTAYVMNTYLKGVKLMWDRSWMKAFDYQRVMSLGALDYAWRLWPKLVDPEYHPKEIARDYCLWLGPFGKTAGSSFEGWAEKNYPYPSGMPAPFEEFGVYTGSGMEMVTGFQAKVDGKWEDAQGFKGNKWYDVVPGVSHERPYKLWVRASSNYGVRQFSAEFRDKKETPWYGVSPYYSNQWVAGFKIPKWSMVHVRGDRYDRFECQSLVFGFRPDSPAWKFDKKYLGPKAGEFYTLTCADTGQSLDLATLSPAAGTPAALSRPTEAMSQQWQFVPAETADEDNSTAWLLINRYSGLPLVCRDGSALQEGAVGDATPSRWFLRHDDDHTLHLEADGRELGELLGASPTPRRWLLHPTSETSPTAEGSPHQPQIWAKPEVVDGQSATRITVTTPAKGAEIEDLTLSLTLPREAGADMRITHSEDNVGADQDMRLAVQSSRTDERGMKVVLTPEGQRDSLERGQIITFTLVTDKTPDALDPTHLLPDDIVLNGLPLTLR